MKTTEDVLKAIAMNLLLSTNKNNAFFDDPKNREEWAVWHKEQYGEDVDWSKTKWARVN